METNHKKGKAGLLMVLLFLTRALMAVDAVLQHRSNVCKITHCSETSRQAKHSGAVALEFVLQEAFHFLVFEGLSEALQALFSREGYTREG